LQKKKLNLSSSKLIIDSHLHLDPIVDGTAIGAVKELEKQLIENEISRAIVLHLNFQPWSLDEFANAISESKILKPYINLEPQKTECSNLFFEEIIAMGFIGIKLHPRLHNFSLNDPKTIELVRMAGYFSLPVLIDAFPDGSYIMSGFNPLSYSNLALACPDTRMIWAHLGGYRVFDFLFLSKRLSNVYLDFSYSLLYFEGSSVVQDIIFAMKSLRFNKVFYGSDYPDRSINISLNKTLDILHKHGLTEEEINKIMGKNIKSFFGWEGL